MEPIHTLLEHPSIHETQNRPPPYRYDDLPQDGHFRYLTLQPGIGEEPLQCSLHTASLAEEDFEAISYVWGSPTRDQEITCDGHTMKITRNLSEVLRRVRLPETPRRLWADSTCINQDNLKEKGHQVAIMGQIYRAAKRVLIYMGSDENSHGPQLCSLLDDVNKMIYDTCKRIDMSWNSFPFPGEDDPILVDARWESMYHLLSEDWFSRGWVVREAAVAEDGQVIWGQSEFTWEQLMRTYIWLYRRALRPYYAENLATQAILSHHYTFEEQNKSIVQAFCPESSWRPQSLLAVLSRAKDLQLSDPRDRIYAFTELSQEYDHRIAIRPDYTASHLKVYRQFAVQYIQSTTSTQILDFVTHEIDTADFDLPSWIPRWDNGKDPVGSLVLENGLPLSSHIGHVCKPLVIDDATLKIRGIVLDTVLYISDVFHYNLVTSETISTLWKVVSIMGRSPYNASQRMIAFLDTLCCGLYDGEWSQWRQAKTAFVLEAELNN
jgi:hypothetical protein